MATHLTILYDARCDFCRSVRAWLEGQPTYVPLRFAAVGSERAQALFPVLEHAATLGEITVVRSDGAVYRGERAYLMVLWALRRYRALSLRLAEPGMRPHTRRALGWLSTNRSRLARFGWLLRLSLG
ncbi:MAG: thiol-disulfide oxidoreductase DCC family protein [Gemmatimonadaceae bacterium]